jgi:hypothetical protein
LATPFDVMLLDDLLPSEPVAAGSTWEVPADLTAGLLAIDTVESGSIEARLETVAAGAARVSLSGTVEGGIDGVPTRVEVSGSFSAPVRPVRDGAEETPALEIAGAPAAAEPTQRHELHGRVEQLSVVIRERRQAGHVAPGFEVEARLAIARTASRPLAPSEAAAIGPPAAEGVDQPAAAAVVPRRQGDGGPGRIWYRAVDGRFDLVRDVRWRIVEDGPSGLVMRLLDRGALVGQCSIVASMAAETEPPSTADVQRDIERSLAGQVLRIDEAAAEDRADGMRLVRVASSGTAEGLPFTWIHYVAVAPHGVRIDMAFMVQESMRDRFAAADRELVAALTAATGSGNAARPAGEPANPDGPAEVREARVPEPPADAPPR